MPLVPQLVVVFLRLLVAPWTKLAGSERNGAPPTCRYRNQNQTKMNLFSRSRFKNNNFRIFEWNYLSSKKIEKFNLKNSCIRKSKNSKDIKNYMRKCSTKIDAGSVELPCSGGRYGGREGEGTPPASSILQPSPGGGSCGPLEDSRAALQRICRQNSGQGGKHGDRVCSVVLRGRAGGAGVPPPAAPPRPPRSPLAALLRPAQTNTKWYQSSVRWDCCVYRVNYATYITVTCASSWKRFITKLCCFDVVKDLNTQDGAEAETSKLDLATRKDAKSRFLVT